MTQYWLVSLRDNYRVSTFDQLYNWSAFSERKNWLRLSRAFKIAESHRWLVTDDCAPVFSLSANCNRFISRWSRFNGTHDVTNLNGTRLWWKTAFHSRVHLVAFALKTRPDRAIMLMSPDSCCIIIADLFPVRLLTFLQGADLHRREFNWYCV